MFVLTSLKAEAAPRDRESSATATATEMSQSVEAGLVNRWGLKELRGLV